MASLFPLTVVTALFLAVLLSSVAAHDIDFQGLYSVGYSNGCEAFNTVTGSCDCPKGSVESPTLHYNSSDEGQAMNYCVHAAMKPKSFGGAFQLVETKSGGLQCSAPNVYTQDCSCPAGFKKLGMELQHPNASVTKSEVSFCVPLDNYTIPHVLEGMYIQSEHKCMASTTTIGGCQCPPNMTWSVQAMNAAGLNDTIGFCTPTCFIENLGGCESIPYCTMCDGLCVPAARACKSDKQCLFLPLGPIGFDCCSAPGHPPATCSGPGAICSDEGQCTCANNGHQCSSGESGVNFCCEESSTCCGDVFNNVCCPEGTTCCNPLGGIAQCCNTKTEQCVDMYGLGCLANNAPQWN